MALCTAPESLGLAISLSLTFDVAFLEAYHTFAISHCHCYSNYVDANLTSNYASSHHLGYKDYFYDKYFRWIYLCPSF